jgi:hypothetical protein
LLKKQLSMIPKSIVFDLSWGIVVWSVPNSPYTIKFGVEWIKLRICLHNFKYNPFMRQKHENPQSYNNFVKKIHLTVSWQVMISTFRNDTVYCFYSHIIRLFDKVMKQSSFSGKKKPSRYPKLSTIKISFLSFKNRKFRCCCTLPNSTFVFPTFTLRCLKNNNHEICSAISVNLQEFQTYELLHLHKVEQKGSYTY